MVRSLRRRDLPRAGMPTIFEQLAVMPSIVKVVVGPLLVSFGVAAMFMIPESYYSWVLLFIGCMLGIPLAWQG